METLQGIINRLRWSDKALAKDIALEILLKGEKTPFTIPFSECDHSETELIHLTADVVKKMFQIDGVHFYIPSYRISRIFNVKTNESLYQSSILRK